MKVSFTIPPTAWGLHAAFIATKKYSPITQQKEYAKYYKQVFKILKKKYPRGKENEKPQ